MTSGILLLNKPTGISSAKALYPVKKHLPGVKVGHAGTLDPFAEGLLLVLVGSATKLSRFVLHLDKRYEATVSFGVETDTLDPEGSVVEVATPPDPEAVAASLPRFRGEIQQVPPSYSALKVGGRRSYELARSGSAVTHPPRSVSVYHLEMRLLEEADPVVPEIAERVAGAADPVATSPRTRYRMTVHCGSGTYIRSLARDIGRAAGSVAHLQTLMRTSVGPFEIDAAIRFEEITDTEAVRDAVIPITTVAERLRTIGVVTIDTEEAYRVRNGVPPVHALSTEAIARINATGVDNVLLTADETDSVAIVHRDQNGATRPHISYTTVFPEGSG